MIRDLDLVEDDIPSTVATWEDVGEFALAFDGYAKSDCAEVANARRCATLTDARTCLFFEQRRWRHFGEVPDAEDMAYIRGLVEIIRFHVRRNMTSIMAPGTYIEALGEGMVECDWSCEGICNDPSRGVLPRCMFFENQMSDERGCIVVGLNPGRAPEVERDYYLSHGPTYQSTVNFWNERSAHIPYYTRLREFSKLLGLAGPILWTELAKCESAASGPTMPAIQTLRRCAGRYLSLEIEAMPPDWPVLAIGQDAFRALAFMSPQRTVVGIPHPTGSRGHFSGLVSGLRDGGSGLPAVRAILNRSEPTATWLQVSSNGIDADKPRQ